MPPDPQSHRLPKLPFVVLDVLLIALAVVIRLSAGQEPTSMTWLWVFLCVAVGGVLLCWPFYKEFHERTRLAGLALTNATDDNARRMERAARQIEEAADSAAEQVGLSQRSHHALEGLAKRIESRVNSMETEDRNFEALATELTDSLRNLLERERENLQELFAERDSDAASIVAEVRALAQRLEAAQYGLTAEAAQPSAAPEPTPKPEPTPAPEPTPEATPAPDDLDAALEDDPDAIEMPDESGDDERATPEGDEDEEGDVAASEDANDDADDSDDAPTVSGDETSETFDEADDWGDIALADGAEAADNARVAAESEPEPDPEREPEPEQASLIEDVPEGKARAAKAGRSQTTLIAQVLIGIGNKPYVRGEGGGLSLDKGVPMDFLEIGKWQWVAPDDSGPVRLTIYKNDEIPSSDGVIELKPGQRRSITPRFPA